MQGKELVRYFRNAPWEDARHASAFVAQVSPVAPADLQRLLSVLFERAVRAQPVAYRAKVEVFRSLVLAAPHESLFLPLVRALEKADPVLRSVLVDVLPKVNQVSEHAQLCKLLANRDPDVREAAAKVVRQVGGRAAFEILSRMCADPGFVGRIEAMDSLVPKAGYHAIPLLRTVLQVGSTQERVHALKYLGNRGLMGQDTQSAAQSIEPALDIDDERVLVQAIISYGAVVDEDTFLDRMSDRLESGPPNIVRAVLGGLKYFKSQQVIELIGRKIRQGPNMVRMAGIDALAYIGTEDVLRPLVEAMSHRQIVVRTRASEVLTELAVSKRVDLARTVIWLLRSSDVNVRRMAAEIASKVGDPDGQLAPKLLRFLRDEDWWVRERVMDALANMGGLSLARHLVEYLKDPSDVVRRYAVGALMRIKDPRTLGALVRTAMEDEDWWVREQAIEAVGELGDQRAVPYLLNIMAGSEESRLACMTALAKLKAQEAAKPVAAVLASDDRKDVRMAAIRCLDELGARSEAPALEALLDDEDADLAHAAEQVLMHWRLLGEGKKTAAAQSLPILDRMLIAVADSKGDDLVVAPGRVPYMKRLGVMTPLSKTVFNSEQVRSILLPHLTRAQIQSLEALQDVDFSYEVRSRGLRFRAHIFQQLSGLSGVFRIVNSKVPEMKSLGLPPIVESFGRLKNGLVLVGGPTGSGKSTTLAALIHYINATQSRHIVTLEDPIEVVHDNIKSLVNQRELGSHTQSFSTALRSTLRQDPDVILVGEMRDYETISFAVTAAETGHLVFGTVHTASADTTVDRLINAFPAGQQGQVRSMLALSLRAVICQHLLRRRDKKGRVLAMEVMLNNDAVSNLIRKGKAYQIPAVIATSRDVGMQSMDGELARLVKEGIVSKEEAFMKAFDKAGFLNLIEEGKAKAKAKGVGGGTKRPPGGA